MPITVTVDPERRRVLVNVRGAIRDADIFGVVDAAVGDPNFRPGFDILSDHTGVTEAITTQQVAALTEHIRSLSRHLAGARWAIVASNPTSYGMMRMLSVHMESVPMEVQVFRERGLAEEWLAATVREGV